MRNRYLLGALTLSMVVGIGLSLAMFSVRESDRSLSRAGHVYLYEGKPFTGIVYSLYTNGWPQRLLMVWRGKNAGTEFLWYDDGALMAAQPYRAGLPHGDWRQWYQDGRVKSLRTYIDGKIDGEMWAWHPNGQLSMFVLYEQDQEISYKSWVSDGTPFYNYVYQDGHKVGIKGGEYCKRLSTLR